MKTWRRALAGLGVAALLLSSAACGKEIDVQQTGAQLVPGTDDLWWFCHETTLIYVEKYSGDDSYEAFFAGGCLDGKIANWFNSPEGQGNEEK